MVGLVGCSLPVFLILGVFCCCSFCQFLSSRSFSQLRDLLKSSLTIWKGFTDKIASQLKESVAIKTAVTESGDAVRAQGLELYCVELQQRLKDMKEERTEQEKQLIQLERMDWPRVIMRQKRTIGTLQESIVQLQKDSENERGSFARAMQKAMNALDNATGKKKRNRSSSSSSVGDNVHNLQEFITDISRQVSKHREEALEWQRRHRQSTKAWVSWAMWGNDGRG